MGIGFSILLLAVGAVLTFALDFQVVGVDIQVIGWILMAAGVLGLILTLVVFMPRRRQMVTETHSVGTVPQAQTTRTTSSTVDDQPAAGEIR